MKKILLAILCLIPSLCFAQYGGGPFPSGSGGGSGTVTAVTASYPLTSTGTTAPNITIDLSAYAQKGTLTNTKWCTSDGTVVNCTSNTPSSLSGLGVNKLQKGATSTTLGDSQIYDNGTNVGIGSTSPQAFLDVEGTIYTNGQMQANSFLSTATSDRSIYGSTAKVSFATFGAGITSVEKITQSGGTYTVNGGSGVLAVDGTIYTTAQTNGKVGVKTASPNADLDVGGGTLTWVDGVNDAVIKGDVEVDTNLYVDGVTRFSGNVGLGTTLPSVALQVGTGNRTAGPTTAVTDTVFKNNVQIDGSIYAPAVTTAYALCFVATSKQLGHCTTTPTSGTCTCVPN